MNNSKLKQTKKAMLFSFFVCSLLISEKALAVWNRSCCTVEYDQYYLIRNVIPKTITFHFKFFEYEVNHGIDNSYLESIEAFFTTSEDINNCKHLFTVATANQTSRTWAWIDLNYIRPKESLEVFRIVPGMAYSKPVRFKWPCGLKLRVDVNNLHTDYRNETWLWLDWHYKEIHENIACILIKAKWHNNGMLNNDRVVLHYTMSKKKETLNPKSLNFSNLTPKQEIRTVVKNNTVIASKKANAIVINGALSEKIQVYTTLGKLVKSFMANKDLVNIELSGKQVYIVHIGQTSYKIAL